MGCNPLVWLHCVKISRFYVGHSQCILANILASGTLGPLDVQILSLDLNQKEIQCNIYPPQLELSNQNCRQTIIIQFTVSKSHNYLSQSNMSGAYAGLQKGGYMNIFQLQLVSFQHGENIKNCNEIAPVYICCAVFTHSRIEPCKRTLSKEGHYCP